MGRLRELLLRFSAEDPLEVAREFTDFARSSGGEDNMRRASNLLMRASADGDLAIALADDDKARLEAEKAVADIHTFEQQTH